MEYFLISSQNISDKMALVFFKVVGNVPRSGLNLQEHEINVDACINHISFLKIACPLLASDLSYLKYKCATKLSMELISS